MKTRVQLLVLALVCSLAGEVRGQAGVLWTGSVSPLLGDVRNWSGAPANADVSFGVSTQTSIDVNAPLSVNSISFSGSYPAYAFTSASGSVLGIGSQGISLSTINGPPILFGQDLGIQLVGNQTWTVEGGLSVGGAVSEANVGTRLTKSGSGLLTLSGASTYSGGTLVQQGTLLVSNNSTTSAALVVSGPVGTGIVTVLNGAALGSSSFDATLANEVQLADNTTLHTDSLHDAHLNLLGNVVFTDPVSTIHLDGRTPTLLGGNVVGPTGSSLTFDSGNNLYELGTVAFSGNTSSNIISVTADGAAVVFANPAALPASMSVNAVNDGYIGVAVVDNGPPLSPDVLMSHIADPSAFTGTFGFDGPDEGAIRTFRQDLDFSAFTNSHFSIGSVTDAILTGIITPPASANPVYRFGGAGGNLGVFSNLPDVTDSSSHAAIPTRVEVSTPDGKDPQLVLFRGNNTYTGTSTVSSVTSNLSVNNSLVILDSPHALPAGATFSVKLGGYVGYTEAAGFPSFADFLSHLAPGGGDALSTVGIDSRAVIDHAIANGGDGDNSGQRVVTENIDLSGVSDISFGTLTGLRVDGIIRAPSSHHLLLSGVDSGHLTVTSDLTALNTDSTANINDVSIGKMLNTFTQKTSDGAVELTGANTYTGGTTLFNGTLIVADHSTLNSDSRLVSGPLGTGTLAVLTTGSTPTLASNTPIGATLYNPIVLSGSLQLGVPTRDDDNNGKIVRPDKNVLILNGGISGTGNLDVFGRVQLGGTSSFTGSTHVATGGIVFSSLLSLPGTTATPTLRAENGGYVGIAFIPTVAAPFSVFLARFDQGEMSGTIGFDTVSGPTNVFSDAINLAGFNGAVGLGSASSAILNGVITPSGPDYRFGGGGGLLQVDSAMIDGGSGARAIRVYSPDYAPLTLRFTNSSNSFSGGIYVSQSAIRFASGALPTQVLANNWVLQTGGYIGTEGINVSGTDSAADQSAAIANFVTRFATTTNTGVIGFDSDFDSAHNTMRTLSGAIDLSRFTDASPNVYLGTTSNLTLAAGTVITLPGNAAGYRFAGYKGGFLQVDATLTGSKSVVIGDPAVRATDGDPVGSRSTVVLNAANAHTLGTTLNAGRLLVGNSAALGTGALTVAKSDFADEETRPFLGYFNAAQSIANDIILNADLEIGGNLTLSGAISGGGELYKSESGPLTLSGHNSLVGGIYISAGNITFAQDDSAGEGPLSMGRPQAPSATFLSSAPVIGTLSGDNPGDAITLAANSVLKIFQDGSSEFQGAINGTNAGLNVVGLTANVPNQLVLSGANTYTGGTTIGVNASVIAANPQAFGTAGNVSVNGGKLVVAPGVTLSFDNTHAITVASGKIGGDGTLAFNGTSFAVGTNVSLAPGFDVPGQLRVSLAGGATLIFDSGGSYHWRLMDAKNTAGGWDSIAVAGTLDIAATAANPFNLQINSVSADGSTGFAGNFDIHSSYSWTLLTATSITGFDPTKFNLDTTGFFNTNSGTFSLTVNDPNAASSLVLNFTPSAVPEPSTWALMLTGLAVLGVAARRRKQTTS